MVSDVPQAIKLSWRGEVTMIVSPSRPQSVVVAVASKVSGLYDVAALSLAFRYNFDPSALFSEIVVPSVKYPEEASGPSTGVPAENCVNNEGLVRGTGFTYHYSGGKSGIQDPDRHGFVILWPQLHC